MKFNIEYDNKIEQRTLTYDSNEYSFDIEPIVDEVNFDIVINKLNLTVVDENKVIQVWGFCPYGDWIKFDSEIISYKKGVLKVVDELEEGFSYRLNNEDLPVYVNIKTGWVCIGNPDKKGNAVEFITNCVAVINNDCELISLWLKPLKLPDFLMF